MSKKFYLTTPVYYVNSKPHIGHSYTQVACDTVARFMKMAGCDVFFMTGTDEHGEKIEKTTIERGFKQGEEKKFVDEIVPKFKDLWDKLNIKYDYFIRTTDDYHIKTVQYILDKLYKDGRIYKKIYKGWFCTPCESFWSQSQAPDGICPDCKRPIDKLDEANYFLKMSEYQTWLIDYIKSNPDFVRPDFRRNEVLGFLNNEPLQDLCISRPKSRMAWGIEIPFDKDFVTYVWFDALINYISGIGYPHNPKLFEKWWPAEFNVIGKDILRHHAVYWPILLHAIGLKPPKSVIAHGWWVIKGEKMSKSKGNVIDPIELVNKYGVDAYRYFLLREVAFGLDGSFSEDALISRFNADLANDLGNLVNRTLNMVNKYYSGKVPEMGSASALGKDLKAKAMIIAERLETSMPNFDFIPALSSIWDAISTANKFIEDSKPWALSKEGKADDLAAVMYTLLEVLRIVAGAIYPVMPQTSLAIFDQLGLSRGGKPPAVSDLKAWGVAKPGSPIGTPTPLFPRIEVLA